MAHIHAPGAEQDPNRPILFDGCEVCESRTNLAGILNLDHGNISALWTRMLSVEFGHGTEKAYRSRAEARAGRELYYVALLLQRNDFIAAP